MAKNDISKIAKLAKKIRKKDEKWTSAIHRAVQQLKKK